MSMQLNHILANLYNELFSKSSKEKCTIFQSMTWSPIVHKILLKATQLFSKHFPPGLPLCFFYFLSHKSKDTSAIPQPSIHHLARKKGALKSSANFTGKHLCWSLFLIKCRPSIVIKK